MAGLIPNFFFIPCLMQLYFHCLFLCLLELLLSLHCLFLVVVKSLYWTWNGLHFALLKGFFFLELDKLLAKKSSDPRELQVVEAMENICQTKYFSTYDYSPPTTIKACKFLIGKFLFICCNRKHNSACLLMLMRAATFFCLFGLLLKRRLKGVPKGTQPLPLSFIFFPFLL